MDGKEGVFAFGVAVGSWQYAVGSPQFVRA